MGLSRPFKEDRLAKRKPLSTLPFSKRRVMSLAFCPQVVSQAASQHFRPSEKQATCEGCFARQSLCSVIYLHPDMSRAASTPTGVFQGRCRPSTHSSLGLLFHLSLFHKFIESVRKMACVVGLSPLEQHWAVGNTEVPTGLLFLSVPSAQNDSRPYSFYGRGTFNVIVQFAVTWYWILRHR